MRACTHLRTFSSQPLDKSSQCVPLNAREKGPDTAQVILIKPQFTPTHFSLHPTHTPTPHSTPPTLPLLTPPHPHSHSSLHPTHTLTPHSTPTHSHYTSISTQYLLTCCHTPTPPSPLTLVEFMWMWCLSWIYSLYTTVACTRLEPY